MEGFFPDGSRLACAWPNSAKNMCRADCSLHSTVFNFSIIPMTSAISRMSTKLALLFSLLSFSVCAQTIRVEGLVTSDDDDSPVPAVVIVEKGTSKGTTTDGQGRYSIDVASDAILVFSLIGYKTKEVRVEGNPTINVSLGLEVNSHWPWHDVGYGYATLDRSTTATSHLSDDEFNQGNIFDPAQLWQGKVAGVGAYKRGGDPHGEFLMRIRGLSSFDPDARPLIVIDGVPTATLSNVDPLDIEHISVLKDGAAAAIYGMRASQGVVLVTTKRAAGTWGVHVTAQAETAAATILSKQPMLTAQEHVAVGGNDLGSATDWQDEITRTGISGNYHLAVSAANESSSFRASAHMRSVNGILLHSGFEQFNMRMNAKHAALDRRLRFEINMAATNRESNFSFPSAFRYANVFLPTAPVFLSSGSYYQAILFDNYNPVAMLEQNMNHGRRRNLNYNARVDFDIIEDLTVTVNAAQQLENNFNGRYYSRNSFFLGQARGGLASRYTDDRMFSLAEGYITYNIKAERISSTLVAGFSYQEDKSQSFGIELGDFPNDDLGYNAIGYSADLLKGQPGLIDIYSVASPLNTIYGGFLRGSIDVDNVATFNASVRQDKSSRLGTDQQTGWFPAVSAGLNLLSLLSNTKLSLLRARVGYGITGSIPSQYDLALDYFEYSTVTGTVEKVRDGNPDLKWEQKNEINAGIDFSLGALSGSLNYYHRKVSDLIQQQYVSPFVRYENVGGLKGNGLEVALSYYVGNQTLRWEPSLVLSTNRTRLDSYRVDKEARASVDAAGYGSTQIIRLGVGERIGEIWGPEFDGVDANGLTLLRDVNGDGIVNPSSSVFDSASDYTLLGNGLPSWEVGWSNRLGFRSCDVNTFFRGAFGHSLVNLLRLVHEPLDAGLLNAYNAVRTDKAVAGLIDRRYSSLYVEKAGFLKLDNITLGYSLPGRGDSWLKSLRVFGTIQNAFVITGYSGVDPEPSIIDVHPQSPVFSSPPDPLVSGIDRNGNYAPARTFMVGLTVGI